MTRSVVAVDRRTPCKRIAALLAQHQIGAMPVVVLGRHVAGAVSKADLFSAQERRLREAQLESGSRFHRHGDVKKHQGLIAAELMTSPAITIHPDAPLPVAARLMSSLHIKRLPVVEADTTFGGGVGGKLIGIVSRCDLLTVYLRPDEDIARDVREMLAQLPQADPGGVTAQARNGIVTLMGLLGSAEEHDLIRVAGRLTWDEDKQDGRRVVAVDRQGDWREAMADPLVLINAFEVPREDAERFIAAWESTRDYLSSQPGYVDTALHQAVTPNADFQFVNIGRWQSAEEFQTATQSPRLPRVSRGPCRVPAASRSVPGGAHLRGS